MSPDEIVRSFFERMQARDWDGAGELLASDLVVDFTETGERFEGAGFLAMNRAYPEGWTIEVVETLAVGHRVAAQVKVTQPPEVFWCAGFYTVGDGVIADGVEHWVTERSAEPPAWRAPFRAESSGDQ
jgi:ketosteroid isomerase-like protein